MISIRPHTHSSEHEADHTARTAATPTHTATLAHPDTTTYHYPVRWGAPHAATTNATRSLAERLFPDVERRPPRHAGLRIGLLLATVTWCWIAAIDVILGEPLRTASVLGGIATFTVVHLVLCLAFGAALTELMDGAMEDPGLVLSVVFGSLLLGVAFAMLTILVSMTSLGTTAWLRIFIGNLIGTAVALATLSRWYPVRHLLASALHDG